MTRTKLFLIGGAVMAIPAIAWAADACCGIGAACCAWFPNCPFC